MYSVRFEVETPQSESVRLPGSLRCTVYSVRFHTSALVSHTEVETPQSESVRLPGSLRCTVYSVRFEVETPQSESVRLPGSLRCTVTVSDFIPVHWYLILRWRPSE